jgi:hypothetical protein
MCVVLRNGFLAAMRRDIPRPAFRALWTVVGCTGEGRTTLISEVMSWRDVQVQVSETSIINRPEPSISGFVLAPFGASLDNRLDSAKREAEFESDLWECLALKCLLTDGFTNLRGCLSWSKWFGHEGSIFRYSKSWRNAQRRANTYHVWLYMRLPMSSRYGVRVAHSVISGDAGMDELYPLR